MNEDDELRQIEGQLTRDQRLEMKLDALLLADDGAKAAYGRLLREFKAQLVEAGFWTPWARRA